jgi:hypothetical protein
MKNLFLNYVNEKYLHKNKTTTKTGKTRTFINVSIPWPQSVNGLASFGVNVPQVYDSNTAGYKSILLGAPEKTQRLSIFNGVGFETISVTNAEIVAEVKAARASASKKTKETNTEKE